MLLTLRAARVMTGKTQKEAAIEFGINKDTLSKLEKDCSNISRRLVSKIPTVYRVPEEYIFFGIESEFFRNSEKINGFTNS